MAGRGSPRDLGQVRDGLIEARRLHDLLKGKPDRPALLDLLLPALTGHAELTDLLSRALVPSPPTERASGGFIAAGYDFALDELREVSGNARRAIAALEARYREQTDTPSLKIRHNGVLGYFIEVPARHADALMAADSGFTHRQTMAGAVRFNSISLHEEATRIAEAGGRVAGGGRSAFRGTVRARGGAALGDCRLRRRARPARCRRRAGRARQRRRMVQAAGLSRSRCSPSEAGRHPVVEAALAKAGERFVANDCALAERNRLWLVGGPNMGGKIHLPAPERADRAAGAGGRLRARRIGAQSGWWTSCSAGSARRTIWRAGAPPSWSRWSRPPRS